MVKSTGMLEILIVNTLELLLSFYVYLLQVMERFHQNFTLKPTGLWISPHHAHIEATPDAIAFCDCHGTWCVEVKCLYSLRDQLLSEAVGGNKHSLCLEQSPDGSLHLKTLHPYHTQVQVQLQLHVAGFRFAHFVVWTEKGMHIETIGVMMNSLTHIYQGQMRCTRLLFCLNY